MHIGSFFTGKKVKSEGDCSQNMIWRMRQLRRLEDDSVEESHPKSSKADLHLVTRKFQPSLQIIKRDSE